VQITGRVAGVRSFRSVQHRAWRVLQPSANR